MLEAAISKYGAVEESGEKVTLFQGRYEVFNLLVPAAAVLFYLIQRLVVSHGGVITPEASLICNFLVNSLGLNVLHNALTFSLLLSLPEMRQWMVESTDGEPWKIWFRAFSVFSVFFIALMISHGMFGSWAFAFPGPMGLALILSNHHLCAQQLGLSQIYGVKAIQNLDYSPAEKERALTSLRREAIGRKLIVALAVAITACHVFFPYMPHAGTAYRLLRGHVAVLTTEMNWALILVIALFVLNTALFPRILKTNKLWFLARIPLCMPTFDIWSNLGKGLTHGVEYVGVYRNMSTRSAANEKEKRRLSKLTWVLVSITLVLLAAKGRSGLVQLVYQDYLRAPIALRIMGAMSTAISVTHYFFDGLIFRMRNSPARKLIAPLL